MRVVETALSAVRFTRAVGSLFLDDVMFCTEKFASFLFHDARLEVQRLVSRGFRDTRGNRRCCKGREHSVARRKRLGRTSGRLLRLLKVLPVPCTPSLRAKSDPPSRTKPYPPPLPRRVKSEVFTVDASLLV